MINKVTLIGNLGKDPEVRHLEGGAVVARLAVATNESYKDKSGEWQTQTEWHNVNMWGPMAERAERSLKKGSLIYIEGKLQTRKWQDKDGNDRYTTEVRANQLRLLDRKDDSDVSQSAGSNMVGAGTGTASTPHAIDMSGQIPKDDDDLPF
jgi:single-strand DNA-binding protein